MGAFSSQYELSEQANNGLFGSIESQQSDGTPNQSSGGFFGMLQDAVKLGVNGYVAVRQAQRSNSQPETTYEQRIVPDNNLAQTAAQGMAGVPQWALLLGGVALLVGVVLLVKD